jgi:hypothetical protein
MPIVRDIVKAFFTRSEALEREVGAVEIYAARHPRPPHVTITQAAVMLGRIERKKRQKRRTM